MDSPYWVTPSDLGSYQQDHSFDLYPVTIRFTAGDGSIIHLLNGSLPTGISWHNDSTSLTITGAAAATDQDASYQFTFRIRQSNGTIADRTYRITILALPQPSSWEAQRHFLGYQLSGRLAEYQLIAIPPAGKHVTYGIVSVPAGMSVDPRSGVLSYNTSVSSSTAVYFDARATVGSTTSDITLQIVVNPTTVGPEWVTSSGYLGTFYGDDYIEINLLAEDPSGDPVSYTISSLDPGFPLSVSLSGLLYGRVPNPLVSTSWNFTVTAGSANGSSSMSLSIEILPSEYNSQLTWNTGSDLGWIDEGKYIKLNINATTQRKSTIVYNVTGGLLPPHLILGSTDGNIIGFCEYHAVPKLYRFDISATDGYQTIVRQFSIGVNKIYQDQFLDAYIPLAGDLRSAWSADVANVRVREPGTVIVDSVTDVVDPPMLNIVSGVVTGYTTPDEMVRDNPWFHQLTLLMGTVANSTVSTGASSTLYRNVVDSQEQSTTTVKMDRDPQIGGYVYPPSINNIRQFLTYQRGFVNGGSGYGCQLSPVLDWSTGSVIGIYVIKSGSGYRSPPEITITGSGSGAAARAMVGLVSIEIADGGQGWTVGDVITWPGNIHDSPAILRVESVGTNGALSSVYIESTGSYLQISAEMMIDIKLGMATARLSPTWGVVGASMISTGTGYECGIGINTVGHEILPVWMSAYFPAMEIGLIAGAASGPAVDLLNNEPSSLQGRAWNPNYIVLEWQGIRWMGCTLFDAEMTTFDGATTNFQESEDPRETLFDGDRMTVDHQHTMFDYHDPLSYDLFQVWGSTMIDAGTTVFDLYSTIFDALGPRRTSNTAVRKLIRTDHKTYLSNNARW